MDIEEIKKEARKEFASSGGRARAQKLSPERRSEISRNAAMVRHQKNSNNPVDDASKQDVV